jgi:hypothetical protein
MERKLAETQQAREVAETELKQISQSYNVLSQKYQMVMQSQVP